LRKHGWFTRSVVVAPLIGLDYGNWPLPVVKLLVFLATYLGMGWLYLPSQRRFPLGRLDFAGNPLTSDRRRWNRDSRTLELFPHLATGAPTFSWLRAAMKATAALQAMGPRQRFHGPVLAVAAGLECVVDNEAIADFARKVHGVSLITIRESKHEILTERDEIREQFFAAFEAFIREN
jgi:lysophospholipase